MRSRAPRPHRKEPLLMLLKAPSRLSDISPAAFASQPGAHLKLLLPHAATATCRALSQSLAGDATNDGPATRRFVPQSCGGLAGAMQWESRGIMFTSLLNCTRHADPKSVTLLSVWPSRQKATRTFLKLPPVIKLSAAAVTNGLQHVACRVQSRAWRNYPTTDFTASLIFCIFSGVST